MIKNNKYYTVKNDPDNVVQQLRVQFYRREVPGASLVKPPKSTITFTDNGTYTDVKIYVYVEDRTYSKSTIRIKKYGIEEVPYTVVDETLPNSLRYNVDDKVYIVDTVMAVDDLYFYIIDVDGVFCVIDGEKLDKMFTETKSVSFEIYPFNVIIPSTDSVFTTIGPVIDRAIWDNITSNNLSEDRSDSGLDVSLDSKLDKFKYDVEIDESFSIKSSDLVKLDIINNTVFFTENNDIETKVIANPDYIKYINGTQLNGGNLSFTFELTPAETEA